MTTDETRCEQVAYADGLAAGLADALAGVDVTRAAVGRFVAVPAWRVGPGAAVLANRLAAAERVAFVRHDGAAPPVADRVRAALGRRLAAARLGLVRRTLDRAVAHLSERVSGGEALIRKQLVVGAIADVLTRVEHLRRQAGTATTPAATADLHDGLDELGWQVAMLFGASGYLADQPARAVYVSALVANVWVARETAC